MEIENKPSIRVNIRKSKKWRRIREFFAVISYPLAAAIVFLIVWETVVWISKIPSYLLPAPSAIVQQGIEFAPRIASHFWITLSEALIGYLIAIVLGMLLAVFLSYSPFWQRSFYPLIVFFDEVPKIAIAPLLVTWFGFGYEPKIILTVVICFFPVFINGFAGLISLDEDYVYLSRIAGAREWETFWKIRFPNALPYLFVGLKMSGSAAIIGAVISEFLAGDKGLGYYLLIVLGDLRNALGFAVIAAMASVGLSLFFGMTILESLAIPWHTSKRNENR